MIFLKRLGILILSLSGLLSGSYIMIDSEPIVEFQKTFSKLENLTLISSDVEPQLRRIDSLMDKQEETFYIIDGMRINGEDVRATVKEFIFKYGKKHLSDQYHDNLVDHFLDLIEEDGSNIKLVLQFIALCSVESNFDQYVPTKYGVGIAQVIYRIHKKYISELGVSKENFYRSPRHNIFVGYHIFRSYWANCGKTLHKAAIRYNGGATKGYAKKVEKRYLTLLEGLKS